jgi:hypothetical protein
MSKLNTAQRKALPSEDFGDPASRLFPIVDQDDVDSAAHLIGKAKNPGAVKARIIAIAKRKGLSIPDAWKTDAKMSAAFALEASGRRVEGDYAIYPNSLLFQAGEYPDKSFSMSPEEMWAAVEQFSPVGGNIEHTSFLAGRACEVRSIRQDSANSDVLLGEVAVPLALDGLMHGHERRLSCEWDRTAKTLTGIALTVNPRIPEAALMSAFAAAAPHTTREGQSMVQTVHDLTAKGGAVCSPANPNGTKEYSSSYFVSTGEAKTLQALHDAACAGGAKCSAMDAKSSYAAAFAALFAGNRHSKADAADIQSIHDLATKQGASCIDQPAVMHGGLPETPKGKRHMANKFSAWFGLGREARELAREAGAENIPPEEHFSVVADEVADAREIAHKEELARFAAKQKEADDRLAEANAALFAATAQRLQGEAAAFADGLIVGNKLLPAEREGLIAALTTAGMDDAASGPVTFANGTQGSRVEQLKAMYSARPAHGLTTEQLDGRGNLTVVMGGQAPKPPTPDDYDDAKLLSMTPAGKQAVTRKKA